MASSQALSERLELALLLSRAALSGNLAWSSMANEARSGAGCTGDFAPRGRRCSDLETGALGEDSTGVLPREVHAGQLKSRELITRDSWWNEGSRGRGGRTFRALTFFIKNKCWLQDALNP